MKKLIVAVAIAFMCSGVVSAQEKTAKEKDAYALVELISKPSFDPIVDQFAGMVKADKVEAFKKDVAGTFPELYTDLSKLYAEEFTHDEIKSLIEFYSSDLGKKIASKQGTMAQKGMMLGQSWGMKVQGIMTKYQ